MNNNQEACVEEHKAQTLRHYAKIHPNYHRACLSAVNQAFNFCLCQAIVENFGPKYLKR
jgi:hypothetical protein